MPTIGAAIAASIAAWLVDELISSFAGTPVRVLVNLVLSVLVFVFVKRWLRELRGD
jgi:membrane protein implicated in regulation of membrane protease activity